MVATRDHAPASLARQSLEAAERFSADALQSLTSDAAESLFRGAPVLALAPLLEWLCECDQFLRLFGRFSLTPIQRRALHDTVLAALKESPAPLTVTHYTAFLVHQDDEALMREWAAFLARWNGDAPGMLTVARALRADTISRDTHQRLCWECSTDLLARARPGRLRMRPIAYARWRTDFLQITGDRAALHRWLGWILRVQQATRCLGWKTKPLAWTRLRWLQTAPLAHQPQCIRRLERWLHTAPPRRATLWLLAQSGGCLRSPLSWAEHVSAVERHVWSAAEWGMFSDDAMARGDLETGLRWQERACLRQEERLRNPADGMRLWRLRQALQRKRFYADSARRLATVPQPQHPRKVAVVLPYDHQHSLAMMLPLLVELRKQGVATIYLGRGALPPEPTGVEALDTLQGMIGASHDHLWGEDVPGTTELRHDWRQDRLNEKELSQDGENYYQGLFEYLANRYRRFSLRWDNPVVRALLRRQWLKADRALSACYALQELAEAGTEIHLLAVSAQTAPAYIYRQYFSPPERHRHVRFHFFINGYENYYSNLGTREAGSLAVGEMLTHQQRRSPLIALRKPFEDWMALHPDALDATPWLEHDRVGQRPDDPEAGAALEQIRQAHAAGRRIFLCPGKVLCDLGVPYDGGPAHTDIADWIRHTVELATQSDALFLIKPHPHEIRPEIARHLTEYLRDLLPDSLPENVLFCGHRWFNHRDLVPWLSAALMWNGTSALELGAAGVPVVLCSHFGRYDYPVTLLYPGDREDYARVVLDPEALPPRLPETTSRECLALLAYLKSEEISIPYRYAPRMATNDPVGVPHWIEEDWAGFTRGEDAGIRRIARQILESAHAA